MNPRKERLIDATVLMDDSYKRHLKRNNQSSIQILILMTE